MASQPSCVGSSGICAPRSARSKRWPSPASRSCCSRSFTWSATSRSSAAARSTTRTRTSCRSCGRSSGRRARLLLAFLLIHLVAGIAVAMKNRAARPTALRDLSPGRHQRRRAHDAVDRRVRVRVPRVSHLPLHGRRPSRHFTSRLEHADTFGMYVAAFRDVKIYALYLAGMALLCLHLGHGAASWLQTLGLRHPKYRLDSVGTIVGWAAVRRLHGAPDRGARRSRRLAQEPCGRQSLAIELLQPFLRAALLERADRHHRESHRRSRRRSRSRR